MGTAIADAQSPDSASSLLIRLDSNFYGNHPIDQIYSCTFITKPFGMEWKTTKQDKKNLYVSKVNNSSQAGIGGVKVGSKLLSFNGELIEDKGAKVIYALLSDTDMPLTITFLKPFENEEEEEKEKKEDKKPELVKRDTTPPAPDSHQMVEIPPKIPDSSAYSAIDEDNKKDSFMSKGLANMIPQVFDDDDENEQIKGQESIHAD